MYKKTKESTLNDEWNFIVNETHRENPISNNLLKRELLFLLQILLSSGDIEHYKTIKMHYLQL